MILNVYLFRWSDCFKCFFSYLMWLLIIIYLLRVIFSFNVIVHVFYWFVSFFFLCKSRGADLRKRCPPPHRRTSSLCFLFHLLKIASFLNNLCVVFNLFSCLLHFSACNTSVPPPSILKLWRQIINLRVCTGTSFVPSL